MVANRQLNFACAFILWAALLLLGAFLGTWYGYGGRRFAFAMLVCAALLAGELFPAASSVRERLLSWFGQRNGALVLLIPLAACVAYSIGANDLNWKAMVVGVSYVLVPTILLASAGDHAPGAWQDYAAVLAIWLPVELRLLYRIWPYPPQLTHILTILFALNVALAVFLFIHRLDGIGYSVEWGPGFSFAVGFSFVAFAVIAIPLGELIGFVHFDPSLARLKSMGVFAIGILFFTAWPEEFLFRGLLQNLLSRTLKNQWTGLIVVSVIFGLAHINNGPFPNWRYALLATIAGFFYGRAWMKTGSIFASCLVHAAVDITWHVFFR